MRSLSVAMASVVGSFLVYGAHLACSGGRLGPRVVPTSSAEMVSVSASTSASESPPPLDKGARGDCGCPTPKLTAFFNASGDEKIVLDPQDASASLDVAYTRSAAGKKLVSLTGVVRAYRADAPSDRPTTLAIRVTAAEGGGKDVAIEATLTTWGASMVAPRVYAVVAKSAITTNVTNEIVEIRGSLTLKDPPTGRSILLDKLTLRKSGVSLLPERAIFHP